METTPDSAVLTRIIRESEISSLMNRYALGLDSLNLNLLSSCFRDPLDVKFAGWNGKERQLSAQSWAEQCLGWIAGFDATQHSFSNLSIDDSKQDAIEATMYASVMHFFAEPGAESYMVGGYYRLVLTKAEIAWKIARWEFTVTWEQGDTMGIRKAMARPQRQWSE